MKNEQSIDKTITKKQLTKKRFSWSDTNKIIFVTYPIKL